MLRSRNSRRRLAATEEQEYERNFGTNQPGDDSNPEFGQSPNELRVEREYRDQNVEELDVIHLESGQEHKRNPKPKKQDYPSNTLARSTDTEGYKIFWQTQAGHLICSDTGHILCSYCGVQSHGRKDCYVKRDDEAIQIFRVHHPDRGNLLSRNQQLLRLQPHNGATYGKHKSLCREQNWIKQFVGEGSKNQWTGKDANQNMEGWQDTDPQREDYQRHILLKEDQPTRSSSVEFTPITSYLRQLFAEGWLSLWG